jgi:hypothetical protein
MTPIPFNFSSVPPRGQVVSLSLLAGKEISGSRYLLHLSQAKADWRPCGAESVWGLCISWAIAERCGSAAIIDSARFEREVYHAQLSEVDMKNVDT